jgi:hypothetical protein
MGIIWGRILPKVFFSSFEHMEFSSNFSHDSSFKNSMILINPQTMKKCLKTWIKRVPCFFNVHLLLPTWGSFLNTHEMEEGVMNLRIQLLLFLIDGLVKMWSTSTLSLTNFILVKFDELAYVVACIITTHVMCRIEPLISSMQPQSCKLNNRSKF